MRNWQIWSICALLSFFTLAFAQMPQAPARLQKAEIIDRNGFERPMRALTLLVPVGWRTRGGIVWNPQAGCMADATRVEWSATAPDGLSGVEMLPGVAWQWNNLPQYGTAGGCPVAAITTMRQFLEALVHYRRPGARILDYRDRPDLVANRQAFNSRTPMPMGEMQSWVQGGEVLIAYRIQGQAIRETIAAVAYFNSMRMAGVYPGEEFRFISGASDPAFAMRAPDGQLDFRLAETIRQSAVPDPQWQANMNRHNQVISRIHAKAAAERSAMIAKTNREISDIIWDGYRERQAIMDKGHERFSQYIHGVETFVDPDAGERYELPSTHDRAFRLNDDTYVLTDDQFFDPYAVFGIDGQELQREP